MNQHDLNRAVAEATSESVDTISALGFSLFPIPPKRPLFIPAQRNRPLKMGQEVRQRKRPRRNPKSPARSTPAARAAARRSGAAVRLMSLGRLACLKKGA